MYFRGFALLDGLAGWRFCFVLSIYEGHAHAQNKGACYLRKKRTANSGKLMPRRNFIPKVRSFNMEESYDNVGYL